MDVDSGSMKTLEANTVLMYHMVMAGQRETICCYSD